MLMGAPVCAQVFEITYTINHVKFQNLKMFFRKQILIHIIMISFLTASLRIFSARLLCLLLLVLSLLTLATVQLVAKQGYLIYIVLLSTVCETLPKN